MILQSKLIKDDLTWSLNLSGYKTCQGCSGCFSGSECTAVCTRATLNPGLIQPLLLPSDSLGAVCRSPGGHLFQHSDLPQLGDTKSHRVHLSCWPSLCHPGVTLANLQHESLPSLLDSSSHFETLAWDLLGESLLLWQTLLGPKREDVLPRASPRDTFSTLVLPQTHVGLLGNWKQLPWKDVSPGPKPTNKFLWALWMDRSDQCLQQCELGIVWLLY